MREVALPDGTIAEFPDTMTDAEIVEVLRRQPSKPAMPTPSVQGTGGAGPLAPPSGGSVTPEQAGTFALEHGPPLIGQTAGAILGSATAPITGPFAPGVSVILGGVGAKYGQDLSNYLLGRPPATMPESAGTFAAGTTTELGGQLLTRGLPLAFRGAMGMRSAETSPRTAEAIGLAEKYGVPLTGAQATGSPALGMTEQIPARFVTGAGRVVKFGETQREASAAAVRQLQERVGGPPVSSAVSGMRTGEALTAKAKAAKDAMDLMYLQAKEAAGETQIPGPHRMEASLAYLQREGLVAPGLQSKPGLRVAEATREGRALTPGEKASRSGLEKRADELEALRAEIEAKPETLRAALKAQLPNLDRELGDILEQLAQPRSMDFAQTRDLELRLGDQISSLMKSGKTHQAKQLIEIRSAIKRDMKEAAQAAGGDFADKLAAADRYAADVYFRDFDKKAFPAAVRKAAKEHPELVVTKILNSDREGIQQIKRVLGQDGPTWKGIQSQVLEDLAVASHATTKDVGGIEGSRFSVAKWLQLTEGPHSQYRMDRLKEMFEPETVQSIQELNRLFRVIQQGSSVFYGANPSGTAQGLLSYSQLAAILSGVSLGAYNLGSGDLGSAAGSFAGAGVAAAGPSVMARFLLAKGTRDIIARGVTQAHGMAAKAARLAGAATRGGARILTEPVADAMVGVPPMNPTPISGENGVPDRAPPSDRTTEGRRVFPLPGGGVESEVTTTVQIGGKWYNIPTIYGGRHVSDAEAVRRVTAAGMKDPDTGRTLPPYDSIPSAERAARARSASIRWE